MHRSSTIPHGNSEGIQGRTPGLPPGSAIINSTRHGNGSPTATAPQNAIADRAQNAAGDAAGDAYRAVATPSAVDDGAQKREPLYRLEERLLREEGNLARALLRRSRLLAEIAGRRKGDASRVSANRLALQNLEKGLWAAWETALGPEEGGRSRQWRQLLSQCNNIGYVLAEQKDQRTATPWLLRPGFPGGPVTVAGPTDVFRAKIAIYWSAATNVASRTTPVRTNDEVMELIKALNQLGAGLAWERDLVSHTPGRFPGLDFEQKTVHAGQSPFNLALLLATALARPGIAKFSGSGTLKMLDLKPWQQFLPRLGARLHQLNPHAPGLPIRLESNGNPDCATIDGETPEALILGLLAAAPFFPQGVRLTWDGSAMPGRPPESSGTPDAEGLTAQLKIITSMYDLFGVPHSVQSDAITVSPALPRLPGGAPNAAPGGGADNAPGAAPDTSTGAAPSAADGPHPVFHVPLDPAQSAMLLTWSRFTGWAMRLEGRWPEDDPATASLPALLRSCGLAVTIAQGAIKADAGPWPAQPVLDVRGHAQAVPLAVILALGAPGKAVLLNLPSHHDQVMIDTLAGWSGRTWTREGSSLVFQPQPRESRRGDPRYEPSDVTWALAAAMLAFRHPGIQLANPEELSARWPGFWSLYTQVLSAPRKRPDQRRPDPAGPPPKPDPRPGTVPEGDIAHNDDHRIKRRARRIRL